jgi:hypothetical protein
MKRFWLFRSNIKSFEYYHKYTELEEFEKKCHDFYLLFPIWLLRKGYFDEVTIWRLSHTPHPDIIFNVDGKLYTQRWVRDFKDVLKYPRPYVSFWRGGFEEYDEITKNDHELGIRMYLGTGKRIYPQYGGKYDVIFQEDKRDFRSNEPCMPFWKTASPHIFNDKPHIIHNTYWDICWPCNFTQITQKGQEEFISTISKYPNLKKLKIVHCGNKPEVGKKMAHKYGITNIDFLGIKTRDELCNTLNSSKFGLCMSNQNDGCPRIVTEMLMTKTPIFLSEKTRLLPLFKKNGVVDINSDNIEFRINWALEHYKQFTDEVSYAVDNTISFEKICQKNISKWIEELKI